MTTPATAELLHAIKQLVDTNHEVARLHRASLPQWFWGQDLETRWAMGHHELTDLLRRELGYQGKQGQRIRVALNDVLRLDVVVERMRTTNDSPRTFARGA